MIIHSADKEGAATRLAKAIGAEGYGVTAIEVESPDRLADELEGCDADARILIWSRPLVSHSLHSGELPRIRQIPGLIEVSADGIKPPSGGDEARVVLVSGWRGQPFHPGWQRIHLELKRLCGTRKSNAAAPAQSQNSRLKPAASPSPASGGGRPRARLVLGGAIGFLLIGTAVGAASWFSGGSPDVQPRPEYRPAPKPVTSGVGPLADPGARPGAGDAVADFPPPPRASSSPAGQSVAAAEAERESARAGRASRPAPPKSSKGGGKRPAPPAQGLKKYSPKYSKVMRQFCERSGRSTPQCRTYLRSVRAR